MNEVRNILVGFDFGEKSHSCVITTAVRENRFPCQ